MTLEFDPLRAEQNKSPDDRPLRFCYARFRYNCDDDPEFEREVLAAFLRTAAVSLAVMVKAVETGDDSALQEAAHGVKGSALTLGADAFGDLCLRLEKMGRESQVAEASPLLHQAEAEFHALEAELRNYIQLQAA